MTTFHKSVAWLEPYYEEVKDLLKGRRLDTVMGYKVPLDKTHRCEAQITRYSEGRKVWYTIALATHTHVTSVHGKRQSRKMGSYTLRDFAHELAHLKHFEHTVHHWELQCRIERRFLKVLKRFEIKDTDVRRPLTDRRGK